MSVKDVPIIEQNQNANDIIAVQNRKTLDTSNVLGVNFISSPGAGKTSIILHTIEALSPWRRFGIIEGDTSQVTIDSDKIRAAGVPVVQISTKNAYHLDAGMLNNALSKLPLRELDVLIVENIGNLVCPTACQLGTHFNVLVASLPEGDDKPYKYPDGYRDLDVLLLNKMDLQPYVDFDMASFRRGVRLKHADIPIFPISCRLNTGLNAWTSWLSTQIERRLKPAAQRKRPRRHSDFQEIDPFDMPADLV